MLVSLSAISGQFAFCGTLNDVLHHGMAGISTPQTFDSYMRGECVACIEATTRPNRANIENIIVVINFGNNTLARKTKKANSAKRQTEELTYLKVGKANTHKTHHTLAHNT